MPRYFIELMYDGTRYHGWQIQKNAVGVQQVLNEALSVLFKKPIETLGCGRTDTGVHARQFFAHLDLENPVGDCKNMVHRLNGLLPNDIAVLDFFQVADDLHARFDATSRMYRYYLHFNKDPFLKGRSAWIHFMPSRELMQEAANLLFNYTDFSSFSKNRTQVKTNVCSIMEAEWTEISGGLIFRIKADRFLRGMVRSLVGSMLLVGEGKITLNRFREIIEAKNRQLAGASVDACGLYLEEVEYASGFRAGIIT